MSNSVCSQTDINTKGRVVPPSRYWSEQLVPIWEKYTLTVEEAAAYFHIGENKLRNIIHDNPDANFILWNGSRAQIKRRLFEDYIDSCQAI